MRKCFLGIDTSCYTSSVAIVDEKACLLADERIVLTVLSGTRGLRQSEMVFQHTRNLPILIERLSTIFANYQVQAIAVSDKPRAVELSYMPAFLPGAGLAKSLGAVLGVPRYSISHQHNHILAGLWSAAERNVSKFIAIQLSGGTTEATVVKDVFGVLPSVEIVGATNDISAGQFIDRLGVQLGLEFPAGVNLERLAANGKIIDRFPVRLFDNCVSFSGYETKFAAMARMAIYSKADIAATAQDVIARTLCKLARQALAEQETNTLLLVGGVAANRYIVSEIHKQIVDIDRKILINADAKYCPDNAVGAAFYAQIRSLAV